jgi:enediyne biosynthesis protein E7
VPEIAPGPKGDPWLGSLRAFRRDVLGLMLDGARVHGDVVRFRLGPIVAHLVNDPALVTQVLQARARQYDKQTRSTAAIRAICDDSLLTTNDRAWDTRRRLIQPAFHRHRVGQLVDTMTACIGARLATWQAGAPFDVASEMMQLTFVIAGKAILGADVSAESASVEQAIAFMLERVYARWGQMAPVPRWVPSPEHVRFRRARASVDRIVSRIIAEHRAAVAPPSDLLTMLMEARDDDTGAGFTDAELRNEAITMLLAGHETTASALSWTFALLAAHPDAAARVRAEVDAVLGQRTPVLDDLPRLTFTTQVIQEAMRLYPSIWAIERRARNDDVIGGFAIPAGSSVIISPYVLHRHPRFWPDPERFDPSRFDGPKPSPAYLPFGAGPRYCVGSEFAMLEARLVVAMVTQAFRLTRAPGHIVTPHPSLTLRLRHGLRMTAEAV